MTSEEPLVSIIIPAHNASRHLGRCLDALLSSSYRSLEIIVVDDASSDGAVEIGREKGVTVLQLKDRSGPAAARNCGAREARGEILLFVDSDIVVRPDTVSRVVHNFSESSDIVAVFGSYDDDPAEKDFLSQYKNLLHHFVHQQASTEAVTFWAGCGAILREVFADVGGFDQERYPRPAIEDVELGLRLTSLGYRIALDKKLQVKHLKRWTLVSLLKTDIFSRALPWSKLILERRQMTDDLNLQKAHKMSAGLLGLGVMILPFSMVEPRLLGLLGAFLLLTVVLNSSLCRFFFQRKGLRFALLAFLLHCFYYLYSGTVFTACWSIHVLGRRRTTFIKGEC